MEWIFMINFFWGIVIILLIIYWYGKRPNYYKNIDIEDFQRFIKGLIIQGGNGSLLFIKHQNSEKFIQFAKYQNEKAEIVINFGFPDAQWSKEYFNLLKEKMNNEKIHYKIRGTNNESRAVSRFLEIDRQIDDINKSVEELSNIAKISFSSMGVDKIDKFKIHFEGELNIVSGR